MTQAFDKLCICRYQGEFIKPPTLHMIKTRILNTKNNGKILYDIKLQKEY